jgi:hypothetical protein
MENESHPGERHHLRKKLSEFFSESGVRDLPAKIKRGRLEVFDVLKCLQATEYPIFVFGGLLRYLLTKDRPRVPRDIDLVVDCASNEQLRKAISGLPMKINRFGGARIMTSIPIDVWALPDTWAFAQHLLPATAENLPCTTVFNVEAVVASLRAKAPHPRQIYEHGFFEGLETQTLDLNFPANPFPPLCVARAFVLAEQLDFWISRRLAEYIIQTSRSVSVEDIEAAQVSHYGRILLSSHRVNALIHEIKREFVSGKDLIAISGSSKSQRGMSSREGDDEGYEGFKGLRI